jgi:hypothetical protein
MSIEWKNVTDDALIEEVRRRGFTIRDDQISPKRWVGLADHELQVLDFNDPDRGKLARAVEIKLKERNHG